MDRIGPGQQHTVYHYCTLYTSGHKQGIYIAQHLQQFICGCFRKIMLSWKWVDLILRPGYIISLAFQSKSILVWNKPRSLLSLRNVIMATKIWNEGRICCCHWSRQPSQNSVWVEGFQGCNRLLSALSFMVWPAWRILNKIWPIFIQLLYQFWCNSSCCLKKKRPLLMAKQWFCLHINICYVILLHIMCTPIVCYYALCVSDFVLLRIMQA